MFWFFAFVVAAVVIWWWLSRNDSQTPNEFASKAEDRLRQAQHNLEQAAQKARETLAHTAEVAQEAAETARERLEQTAQEAAEAVLDTAQSEDAPETAPSAPETAPSAPETAQSEDAPTIYDDFTRINGIGEASQAILYAAGITTYRQLAALSEDELLAIIRAGGGRKSPSMATWAAQAQALLDNEA